MSDPVEQEDIIITPIGLAGTLRLPARAIGLVLFAHGSGSSRLTLAQRLATLARSPGHTGHAGRRLLPGVAAGQKRLSPAGPLQELVD